MRRAGVARRVEVLRSWKRLARRRTRLRSGANGEVSCSGGYYCAAIGVFNRKYVDSWVDCRNDLRVVQLFDARNGVRPSSVFDALSVRKYAPHYGYRGTADQLAELDRREPGKVQTAGKQPLSLRRARLLRDGDQRA